MRTGSLMDGLGSLRSSVVRDLDISQWSFFAQDNYTTCMYTYFHPFVTTKTSLITFSSHLSSTIAFNVFSSVVFVPQDPAFRPELRASLSLTGVLLQSVMACKVFRMMRLEDFRRTKESSSSLEHIEGLSLDFASMNSLPY